MAARPCKQLLLKAMLKSSVCCRNLVLPRAQRTNGAVAVSRDGAGTDRFLKLQVPASKRWRRLSTLQAFLSASLSAAWFALLEPVQMESLRHKSEMYNNV